MHEGVYILYTIPLAACIPSGHLPAMPRPKSTRKRENLARDDRRIALLDVAASVVEHRGWQALSMISVAEGADVSRQLVYQHFASVDELMADTMSHLFRERFERILTGIEEQGDDLVELMRIVYQATFDDRPGRVRALWQMITATYSDSAEATRVGQRLRRLLIKVWAPVLEQRLGLVPAHSQALAWMLQMAFWGAHQQVQDGEIDRENATRLFTWMMLRLLSPAGSAALTPGELAPGTPGPSLRPAATGHTGKPRKSPAGTLEEP